MASETRLMVLMVGFGLNRKRVAVLRCIGTEGFKPIWASRVECWRVPISVIHQATQKTFSGETWGGALELAHTWLRSVGAEEVAA